MLANLTGTLLAPGVSKNGRLYTSQNIERAVTRMQARLADENARPIVMRTHHGAGDDTTQIVGHITAVNLDDQGHARYEADLNHTAAARDILAAAGDDKSPSLRNVSIYGWWGGNPKTVRHDGQMVETADDLEIDAVDFTAFPGVEGARIHSVTPTGERPAESAIGRHVITESVDAQLSIVDEAATPMGKRSAGLKGTGGPYADPGYQKDKKQRYQLDTKAHAKAAWSYINQGVNAKAYNATQLKAVKGRIRAALKKFGVDVTKENAPHPAQLLGETTLGECMCCDDGDDAGFSISANNGPINVNISAWHGIDPAELEAIAQCAMQAACDALKALDPDMDADIDVEGAPKADSDNDMGPSGESSLPPVTATPRDMAKFLARKKTAETTETPAPTPAGPTVKESAVSDAQQPAAEQAAPTTEATAITLNAAELATVMSEAFKPLVDGFAALAETVKATQSPAASAPATESTTPNDREAAPAAAAEPTAETAETATTAESTTKAIATEAQKAVAAAVRESIPAILESYGLPRRKGVIRTAESAEAATPADLWEKRNQLWDSLIPGAPAPQAG